MIRVKKKSNINYFITKRSKKILYSSIIQILFANGREKVFLALFPATVIIAHTQLVGITIINFCNYGCNQTTKNTTFNRSDRNYNNFTHLGKSPPPPYAL